MTTQRVLAVVAAGMLIVGAWFVRDRVIDDGGASDPSDGAVVCIRDLEEICRAVEDDLGVDIRIASVDETLEVWSSEDGIPGEVWVTTAPFPERVDSLRENARLAPIDSGVETVASSPLTLVANADIADDLTTCGDPVDWVCLGSDLPGTKVGFAPFPHTAIGQLGVTTAVLGFGGGSIPGPGNPAFTVWARQISAGSRNGAGEKTAVASIQTRPSLFDVAVGAEAELVDPADDRFVLLAPADPTPITVVVATPTGTRAPSGLVNAMRDALATAGWTSTATASTSVSADAMLAVREVWKGYL